MIHEKSHSRPKIRRKGISRSLNIIYFIDAHKTRSFQISLKKLYTFSTLLVLLLTWAVFSLFVVIKSYEKSDLLNDRLHGALSTIFEYQSRYDGVYEQAYPKIHHDLAEKNIELARQEALVKPDESPAETDQAPEQQVVFVKQTIDFSPESTKKQSNPDWPIIVEDVSFHQDLQDMELNFAIRNAQSPDKAEGYIWSVLTLSDAKGKLSYIGSPSGIKIDDKGDLTNPGKGANWYSIRYYKAKSFYFHLEDHQKGHVKEILIGMKDLHGRKSFIRLPVKEGQPNPTVSASNTESESLKAKK